MIYVLFLPAIGENLANEIIDPVRMSFSPPMVSTAFWKTPVPHQQHTRVFRRRVGGRDYPCRGTSGTESENQHLCGRLHHCPCSPDPVLSLRNPSATCPLLWHGFRNSQMAPRSSRNSLFLGDFTDETDGDPIKEFASGGAKNYGYLTMGGKVECKVRGFSLNYRNKLLLNVYALRENILKELDDPQEERHHVGR